jgi:hypothetical protein
MFDKKSRPAPRGADDPHDAARARTDDDPHHQGLV